jgi:hypothetical protein
MDRPRGERYRHKSIIAVLPPGRQYVASLIDASNSKIRLSFELLERCQFVDRIVMPNGETITIPDKYKLTCCISPAVFVSKFRGALQTLALSSGGVSLEYFHPLNSLLSIFD